MKGDKFLNKKKKHKLSVCLGCEFYEEDCNFKHKLISKDGTSSTKTTLVEKEYVSFCNKKEI